MTLEDFLLWLQAIVKEPELKAVDVDYNNKLKPTSPPTWTMSTWTPTNHLRWHRHVAGELRVGRWDETVTLRLEQRWVDQRGHVEWRELPTHETFAEKSP